MNGRSEGSRTNPRPCPATRTRGIRAAGASGWGGSPPSGVGAGGFEQPPPARSRPQARPTRHLPARWVVRAPDTRHLCAPESRSAAGPASVLPEPGCDFLPELGLEDAGEVVGVPDLDHAPV